MTKIQNSKLVYCRKNEMVAQYEKPLFHHENAKFRKYEICFYFFVFWSFRAFVINICCFGN